MTYELPQAWLSSDYDREICALRDPPNNLVRGYVVVRLGVLNLRLSAHEAEKLIGELAREIALLDAEKAAVKQ